MPWRGVPTSLNEGRGEVVVPVLVVVLACLVDRWRNGGPWKGERVTQMRKCAKYGRAVWCHFRKGEKRDFPWCPAVPKACDSGVAENKPC